MAAWRSTGLLVLADLGRFAEIASPATLLVVLGLTALHAERAFPEGDGPFSRRRFGRAFFHSSQALLGSGLLLLMGAQLVGWSPAWQHLGIPRPAIVAEKEHYFAWTFLLTLAGAYAFLYSHLVVRQVGTFFYLAVGAFAWAQLQVLLLWNVPEVHFPLVFAGTALVLLVFGRLVPPARRAGLPAQALDAGHVLLSLALLAGGLLALSNLALSHDELLRLGQGQWRAPLVTALRGLFLLGAVGALPCS